MLHRTSMYVKYAPFWLSYFVGTNVKVMNFTRYIKDNWLCPCGAKLSMLGYVPLRCLTKSVIYIWY